MSGQAGRSGRPALGVEHHLRARTFRRDRHGPPPNVVELVPTTTPGQGAVGEWTPAPEDLDRLGRMGKAFVMAWLAVHVCSVREGEVVLAAARARDAAHRWERRSRRVGPEQARFSRLALGFERQFTNLLATLKVQA